MNTFKHIRTTVFDATQVEMAAIAGVRQATISRWESGECTPSLTALRRIRAEARRRGCNWNDSWLLEEIAA
jgi:DNA-binding XRE family transcriptional regulator